MSLRDLGAVSGQLRRRHDLNVLAMEALAAAVHLGADVFISGPSPNLQVALAAEGRDVALWT